jgi:hypothetical protein
MSPSLRTGTGNVTTASTGAASGATSLTLAKPANVVTGDMMIAILWSRNGTTAGFTGIPSGWNLITTSGAATSVGWMGVYAKLAGAGEASTHAWTGTTSGRLTGMIGILDDANNASLLDIAGGYATLINVGTTAAELNLPTISPANNGGLLVAVGGQNTTGAAPHSFDPPAGMTDVAAVATSTTASDSSLYVGQEALSVSGATGNRHLVVDAGANNSSGQGFMFVLNGTTTDTVDAGADQSAIPAGAVVYLAATSSSGAASWSQVSGGAVTITSTGALTATFVAPSGGSPATLVFRATNGAATDDVTISVDAFVPPPSSSQAAIRTGAGNVTTGVAGSGTSVSVAKPGNAVIGDTLIAFVWNRVGTAEYGTPQSGWTKIAESATTTVGWIGVYTHPVATSGASTYTWAAGASGRHVAIVSILDGEYTASVVEAVGTVSTITGTNTSGAALSLTSISPIDTNELLVAVLGNNTTANAPRTFTESTALTLVGRGQTATGTSDSTLEVYQQALSAAGATGARAFGLSDGTNVGSGEGFLFAIRSEGIDVSAGADQSGLAAGSLATLSATTSRGTVVWSQVSGTVVSLTQVGNVATFTTPSGPSGSTLVFRATNGSTTDDVSVGVLAFAGSVNAGVDQASVEPWASVTLTAVSSSGSAVWSQVSGTPVTLLGSGLLARSFVAPADFVGGALVFRATNGTVTDDVSVTVLPATDGRVISFGVATPARILKV